MKRLRSGGYNVSKIFDNFSMRDPRRWVIVINSGEESVLITCYANDAQYKDTVFEINDGGKNVPKNFQLHTKSIEVLINYLRDYQVYGNHEQQTYKKIS